MRYSHRADDARAALGAIGVCSSISFPSSIPLSAPFRWLPLMSPPLLLPLRMLPLWTPLPLAPSS